MRRKEKLHHFEGDVLVLCYNYYDYADPNQNIDQNWYLEWDMDFYVVHQEETNFHRSKLEHFQQNSRYDVTIIVLF